MPPHSGPTPLDSGGQRINAGSGRTRLARGPSHKLQLLFTREDAGGDVRGDEHARLLGQAVHRALEVLTVRPVATRSDALVQQAVAAALRSVGLAAVHQDEAEQRTRDVLFQPALQPWLDPDRLLWADNEVALSHEGQTLRLDRLVARQTPAGREWWVIDYKLSLQPDALLSYRQQLGRYVEAVKRLQPGEPVHAAFISGDGAWLPLEGATPA